MQHKEANSKSNTGNSTSSSSQPQSPSSPAPTSPLSSIKVPKPIQTSQSRGKSHNEGGPSSG